MGPAVGQVVGGVPAPPDVLAVREELAHRRGEGAGIGVQQSPKRLEKRLDRLVILPKHAVLEGLGGPSLAEVPAEGEPVGDGALPWPRAGVAAVMLGLSTRQCERLFARYKRAGPQVRIPRIVITKIAAS